MDGRRKRQWNIKEATWGKNRYEVTVTRNLFKSRPWEKQTNNQFNCKIEFPASRKAGSALLQSLGRACRSSLPAPFLSSRIRRLRSEVKDGRGNFCANIMVYSREGFCLRGNVNKVRPWLKNIRRSWANMAIQPHCQQITSSFLLRRRFVHCLPDTNFMIYHKRV